jgi:hypothetical protein
MINSINHPWGISQKMKDRMGSTWADMDFEINDRLSTHNMKENLMDQSVGNLYISNIYIKMKYKDLLTINKQLKKHVNHSYNSDIEEKFPVDIKSHTLLLNKKEIQRLEETIHITISSLLKKYQLGLYL